MWKTVKLGDVCKIQNGGTPSSGEKSYWGGNIQWLTPKDMGRLESKFVYETERQITVSGLENSSAKIVPKNSVILSCRAPIGHVFINTEEMAFNQGCKGLVPQNCLMTEYLYYFLYSSKQLLNDLGTGATFKEISGKTLSSVPIPLPPLAEQQRIVEKLDKAFAEIDRAIEATERRREELVAIYDSKVTEILSRAMIECPHTKLSKLCSRITVGYVGKMSDQYLEDGIKFLRSQSIRPYRISHEGLLYISERFNESISKSQLRRGDVCVVRTGYPGTAAVVTEEWDGANCSDLVIFTPLKSLHSEFLELFFNADFGKSLVLGKVVGAAQKHFNVTSAKDVDFPEVPIEKQKQIVSISRELRSICDEAISIAVHKRAELIKLKTAILAQELEGPAR